ncbi:hypothetical protein BHOIPH791_01780 [Bartonella henselae]|uniref:Phage integrase n=1 Tax=Bartonella henselae TaxID=38323 RepID=X5LLK5_BARHN|nr:hypothetical protein Q654_00311 [Bartonella henselae JK 50]ETS10542.1 hypothetical protein Q655_00262 [Bartonella henselae JK 51]UAK84422.1 hypothetical protein K8O99_01280 [Bartonella henselae]UJM36341.1 hypothetical protein KAE77_03145 [Bartonella henselae]UJM37803.1 hypothetical protein KAE71_02930 [Bartonella henselae]
MALSLYHLRAWCRKMDWRALRNFSLKQTRELAIQCHSVLHERRDPIKEREKQKREAMLNLHDLKDIAPQCF